MIRIYDVVADSQEAECSFVQHCPAFICHIEGLDYRCEQYNIAPPFEMQRVVESNDPQTVIVVGMYGRLDRVGPEGPESIDVHRAFTVALHHIRKLK